MSTIDKALPAAINPADVQTTELETSKRVELAQTIEVTDKTSMQFAEDFACDCRMLEKQIDERFEPAKKATHAAHKAVTDLISSLKKGVEKARGIVEPKIFTFRQAEQKRIAEENEKRRKEQQEKDDADKLARAAEAEAKGDTAMADRIIEEPSAPLPPAEVLEKSESVKAYRTYWHAEVFDPRLVPREYCVPDEKALNKIAEALKITANIPGVRFYSTQTPIYK